MLPTGCQLPGAAAVLLRLGSSRRVFGRRVFGRN